MFMPSGKTVFICKALIEVQVLVWGLTGSKSGSGEFAKAIYIEAFKGNL